MNAAASIRVAITGREPLVTDTKSMADYAGRIARERGRAIRQRKTETGGWELQAVSRRKKK
jgi:hypothetical protein